MSQALQQVAQAAAQASPQFEEVLQGIGDQHSLVVGVGIGTFLGNPVVVTDGSAVSNNRQAIASTSVGLGGGIFAPRSSVTIDRSAVNDNIAQHGDGGGIWVQSGPWQRFQHDNLRTLRGHSDRFVAAARRRSAPRRDSAPVRTAFPHGWELDLQRPLQGTVICLRRTNDHGEAELLGRRPGRSLWPHRLVRAEVDLTKHQIRFYRLRRREPSQQPLITTVAYEPPTKPFLE
jgi:hypothetical protein